jgi:hypothetical protein
MFKSIEVGDLARYERWFPDLRFVHIVRHPVSNYESLKRTDMVRKRKPFWFQGGDILRTQLEDRWVPHVRFLLDRCRRAPERHTVVRYEDVCDRPEVVVKDVCSWLGVTPPADPALQTVLGGRRLRALPVNPSQEGVETPARVVDDMARRFGYEDVLTGRERRLILARTYRLGQALDYYTSADAAALPGRLGLLGEWLPADRWERMNADSRWRLAAALARRRLWVARTATRRFR